MLKDGLLQSKWTDVARIRTCLRFYTFLVTCKFYDDPIKKRDFMHVLVTCKYNKDRIKTNRETVEPPFSPL